MYIIYTYVHIYICIHVYICIYICICMYMHIHIYTSELWARIPCLSCAARHLPAAFKMRLKFGVSVSVFSVCLHVYGTLLQVLCDFWVSCVAILQERRVNGVESERVIV